MEPEDELDQLIGAFYEAALQPELWNQALDQLMRIVDAQTAHLLLINRQNGQVDSSFLWVPELSQDEATKGDLDYASYYHRLDPRMDVAMNTPAGEWMVCHRHFDDGFVRHSEFFNDYLIPYGFRYLLGVRLADMEQHSAFLGIHRCGDRAPFSEAATRGLHRVTPHLARAARLFHKSEALRSQLEAGWGALSALSGAILIVDQHQLVRFANQAAEAMLAQRKGIQVKQGRLTHANTTIRNSLAQLVKEAATAGRGSATTLTGETGRKQRLMAVPLSARSRLATPWQIPLVLLMISDPATQQLPPERLLRQLFGLSQAEIRLAQALLTGMEATEYARDAGISANTVRSQLRSLFDKTGTRRQTDLVRLLSSLPPLRFGSEKD